MNRIYYILCLGLGILFSGPAVLSVQASTTSDGILEIQSSDLSRVQTIENRWFFKADDDPAYSRPDLYLEDWDYVHPYYLWNMYEKFKNHRENSWYRLLVNNKSGGARLALILPMQYSGTEWYLNGSLFYSSRRTDASGSFERIPGKPDIVTLPSGLLKEGGNVIAVKSGFLDFKGGISAPVRIAAEPEARSFWLRGFVWNIFLSSLSAFLVFFFGLIFFFRRKEHYYLYFSILALSAAGFIIGYQGFVLWVIDSHLAYVVSTYFCAAVICMSLVSFVNSFLGFRRNNLIKVIVAVNSLFAAAVLAECIIRDDISFTAEYLYDGFIMQSLAVFLYALWLSIKGFRLKRPYAAYILASMSLLASVFIINSLSFLDILYVPDLTAEGYFAMTLIFASALASRFAKVHTQLETAHGDLLVLDRMKDDFLATTSHELRTPLHGITGLAETLLTERSGPLNTTQREDISYIASSSKRLTSLVNEILDFSKLRADRADLMVGPVRLSETIPSIVSLIRGLLGDRPVEVHSAVPAGLPVIIGDKNRIEQILLNILGNAAKYTERGSIAISAGAGDDGITIRVSDTGVGIEPDRIEKIWDPYVQADSADTRMAGGAGLGLAITKKLVELHGGTIKAASTPGRGSMFTVFLPFEPSISVSSIAMSRGEHRAAEGEISTEVDRKIAADSIPDTKYEASPLAGELIMAVDDDEVSLHVLKRILIDEGYRVLTASDAMQAYDMLDAEKPQLILLDIMLPRVSGYEILTSLKTRYPDAYIPVIMVSAKNQLEDLVKSFTIGCSDYLTKPYNPRELLVRVQNQLVMKHMFEMEKRIRRDLTDKKQVLESSLVERGRQLSHTVDKMKEWEEIIVRDLEISKSFIARLMASDVRTDRVAFSVTYQPLIEIGGDLYDIYELPDGTINVFLADATGHGINASLNSITIMSEYNLLKKSGMTPGEIIRGLNSKFCLEHSSNNIIFTCALAQIDLEHDKITFAVAGHPEQYMRDAEGVLHSCRPRGPIIGLKHDARYETHILPFRPGAALVMYTDGLIDDFGAVSIPAEKERRVLKDERYLKEVLEGCDYSLLPEEFNESLMKAMKGTGRNIRYGDDDVSIITLRRMS